MGFTFVQPILRTQVVSNLHEAGEGGHQLGECEQGGGGVKAVQQEVERTRAADAGHRDADGSEQARRQARRAEPPSECNAKREQGTAIQSPQFRLTQPCGGVQAEQRIGEMRVVNDGRAEPEQ